MSATMNATRLAVADRFAERLALVDVGDDVVEHGLARCRRRAPPSANRDGAHARRRTRRRSPPPSRALAGTDTLSSTSWPVAAARRPIAGSASTDTPLLDDSTMNRAGPCPSRFAATTNSSAFAAARHEDLHAVDAVAARGAYRGGLRRERVEQRRRLAAAPVPPRARPRR